MCRLQLAQSILQAYDTQRVRLKLRVRSTLADLQGGARGGGGGGGGEGGSEQVASHLADIVAARLG